MEIRITESKRQSKTAYGKQLSGILLETALIWLSAGGGLLLFMSVLTEQERMAPILGSVLLMAVFCTATERMGKYGLYGRLGLGMVSIAGIFLFHGQLLDGMALYWNDMADILGSRAGIYLKRFETAGIQGGDAARMVFLIYLGMAAAVCGFLILKLKFYLLVLAWALVLPVLSGILGMEPDAGTGVIFYMGILLELNLILSRSGRKRHRAESSRAFLTGSILACAVMLAAGILLEQFMPSEDYGSSTEAKKEALDGISSLRYRKGKINTLPDGKLKECGAWSASDDTALSVTMENPDSLYLRGFVGSVYDGSSWESLDTEDAYKQRTLFYWLHQDGFYGETQLSRARALADDDALSDKVSEVDIKNEKADSRYLYTPYEITELPVGYRKETPFADSMLKAKGLFGARNYHYQANGNLVKDFTVLGARVYQALARDEGDSYRDDESYYNAFVYSQDTKLSGALETLFRKELGDGGNREQGHTDYYTAISRIRSYLEKNMTYSSQTDVFSEDGDFIENFLTTSKIGHSVHFATAAALMFRYYGIPARYVEGYLITPQDIEGKQAGDTIEIPGTNGHAWTEIYVDGLGWIPLEMTPSYYGVMEEANLKTGLEAKGKMAASIPETESQPPVEENIRTNFSLKLALFGIEKFLLLFLIVFDTVMFLFILAVIFLRTFTNRKRRKCFASQDTKLAVRAMAGYARALYEHGTQYSDETTLLYERVRKIGQKAAFSPHPVSASERHDTASCIRHLKKELKASASWYDRWIMKYIERLY